jgi:asparagine N-glycosylation enzyme membrane subunit Stt3
MRRLRHCAATQGGRLLRVLLVRLSPLSAGASQRVMLHNAGQHLSRDATRIEARSDWAHGLRACLIWGIPAAILLASSWLPERALVVVWPPVLTFMGVACLLNARRCGRIHCYFTGPFFLALAALTLLYGIGIVPLGAHGWSTLSLVLVIGAVTLTWVPERILGQYRPSSRGRR